jgi:hypothetical protein
MIMTRENYPNPTGYVKRWKWVKEIAKANPRQQVNPFDWFPEDASSAYRRFTKALHARINTRGGLDQRKGRKYSEKYQNAIMGDCLDIRKHFATRMIIHEHHLRTKEMRKRYDHIVTHHWEL